MPAHYVQCKFREEDTRSYTYESAGIEVEIGDQVKVPDRSGDGWKRVFVVGLTDEPPPFACKPILGKLDPEPAAQQPDSPETPVDALSALDDEIQF